MVEIEGGFALTVSNEASDVTVRTLSAIKQYTLGHRFTLPPKTDMALTIAALITEQAWLAKAHHICSMLGCPPGHIEDRLHEAERQLRCLLDDWR